MQKLPDFVPALSHHLKPPAREISQFTRMLFHPRIDGRIALNAAVESQQFRSLHPSTFRLRDPWLHIGNPECPGPARAPKNVLSCDR
jgi:hypothetical protein